MLDFTKIKKKFMTVKIDEETTLYITSPRKKDLENMFAIQSILVGGEVSNEDVNLIYDTVADLLSNNKNKTKITADYISEIFGLDDIVVFLQAYMEFVTGAISQKN